MGPFLFHHGRTSLSFAGTLRDRASQSQELLDSPAALAEWLVDAGLLKTAPAPSVRAYRSALELREAIARSAGAVVASATPAKRDVELLNDAARRWNARPVLDAKTLTLVDDERDPVHGALGRIARDAIELLGSPGDRARLRTCGVDTCGSLFLTPPGRDRRWCSMARCGNRAKVAAFRARTG